MREAFTIPWAPDEISFLARVQQSTVIHPYTCNGARHFSKHVHDHEVKLIPTENGWECPEWADHEAAGETR